MKKILGSIEHFFFAPATAAPLGVLRIGVALVLVAQAFMLRTEIFELFSPNGLVQGVLADYLARKHVPQLGWLTQVLAPYGVTSNDVISWASLTYFASLILLAAGLFTRAAAVVTFLLHWTFVNTASQAGYGVDAFAHIFLFFFVIMPVGAAYSLDSLLGRYSPAPTWENRLSLRVVQLELCLIYFLSGYAKAQGEQWWSGELMWRVYSLPMFHLGLFDTDWIAYHMWVSKLLGWSTLIVETLYPIFIWPKATRRLWVVATVMFHVGIAVTMALGTFGFIMATFTIAAFGFSAEPADLSLTEATSDAVRTRNSGVPSLGHGV